MICIKSLLLRSTLFPHYEILDYFSNNSFPILKVSFVESHNRIQSKQYSHFQWLLIFKHACFQLL